MKRNSFGNMYDLIWDLNRGYMGRSNKWKRRRSKVAQVTVDRLKRNVEARDLGIQTLEIRKGNP